MHPVYPGSLAFQVPVREREFISSFFDELLPDPLPRLDRQTCFSVCIETADEHVDIAETMIFQNLRHTGA